MELFLFAHTSKGHGIMFHAEAFSLRMLLDQAAEASQFPGIGGNFPEIRIINADAETGYVI